MSANKEKVLEYLKLSVSQETINTMLDVSKNVLPSGDIIPDDVWEDCKSIYDIEELYRRLTPIYQEYYNDEDLDYILGFLKNPKSQKYINLSHNTTTLGRVSEVTMGYMNEVMSVITLKIESGGYGF
jgi:hypothetical protein